MNSLVFQFIFTKLLPFEKTPNVKNQLNELEKFNFFFILKKYEKIKVISKLIIKKKVFWLSQDQFRLYVCQATVNCFMTANYKRNQGFLEFFFFQ